ncbi:disintegrin and metalloproteinase domain-containing protein 21-like [Hemicordylus capensis]|uniref:disintegrin and metalloproteinase domain-containing protein 21-like n=1 Tax=Hemicordylus capensis TaxID=884348 RepID=UPI0023035EE5|nr:disintegrin and metalloproteinase domain-containing protein 21-like [Hemicordylus capensis]
MKTFLLLAHQQLQGASFLLDEKPESGVVWQILPLSGKMTSSFVWLLVVILRNSLREAAGQTPPQGFRYSSYEVTIPRKLTPKYGHQDPQDVSYWLQIEGKGHMLHLRQKRNFVPKHFPIFTYSTEGDIQVDYPFIRDDCFYHGFVQYKPLSLVTLSTCSGGLRGLLRLDNKTYEIQPVQPSDKFQHVVYRLEEEAGAVRLRCGLTEEERHHQENMIHSTKNLAGKTDPGGDWWTHSRYVKVAIVVEHERYVQFDKNETLVIMRVMDVIHTANSFYEPLNVLVTAVGLEIWSEKNLIEISNDIAQVLSEFTKWRKNTLVKRLANDAGHLFTYKRFGTTLGLAYIGTVCQNDWAAGVESYMSSSLSFFVNTFVHELGHNLGMRHDEKYCTCVQRACIMAAANENSDKFSNCSYADYFKLRNSHCLLIPPDPSKVYKRKYCGNKVVDNGEQCDCGSKVHCESDPCCQSNCMLRSGASCASGLCCTKCQYRQAGTICREKIGNCDLPEYCNGTSEHCPEDVYVQDGTTCMDGAYCYHGNCSTHNGLCQIIFGKKARAASEACFRKINAQGDRFGNCGLRHGIYNRCKAQNSLCGRIQCENVDELPSLEEHSTIIQTPDGSRLCWGTDYHDGMDLIDIGAVRDGTPCGTDMMCVNGECISMSLLQNDCNVTKCHYHGICNTHQNCHCDYGWAPPDCQNKGYGGSIDSGPLPKRKSVSTMTIEGIVLVIFTAFGAGCAIYYRFGVRRPFER